MKDQIAQNIVQLRGRIAEVCQEYDRDADDITIVAVTKTQPSGIIRQAVAAGLREIGESRVQEAALKIKEAGPIARYHLIGHLQTNKVKKALEVFDVIQSVDSLKLAEEISRQADQLQRRVECLVEVNCSGESAKFGVTPDECDVLLAKVDALANIDLVGLMTIGPLVDDDDAVRSAFALCRDLFKRGRDRFGDQFDCLSMGMSDDYPLALAEGSTMIRVGTSLFGPRRV